MKKIILAIIVFLMIFQTAQAGLFIPRIFVKQIRLDNNTAYIRVETREDVPPHRKTEFEQNTCSHYGMSFKFQFTDSNGAINGRSQVWLNALMLAYSLKSVVALDYLPSSTPGTDQNGGCTKDTLARIVQIKLDTF